MTFLDFRRSKVNPFKVDDFRNEPNYPSDRGLAQGFFYYIFFFYNFSLFIFKMLFTRYLHDNNRKRDGTTFDEFHVRWTVQIFRDT